MRFVALVVAFVACAHAGVWAVLRGQADAPAVDGQLTSVSYTPYGSFKKVKETDRASPAEIRSDLRTLAPLTRAVRTYSATQGVEFVPPIAQELGLKVSIGAWLQADPRLHDRKSGKDAISPAQKKFQYRNERELRAAIAQAKRYSNINAIVVGNETVYRGDTLLLADEKSPAPDSILDKSASQNLGPEEIEKALERELKQFIPERLSPEEQAIIEKHRGTGDYNAELAKINVARLIRIIQKVKREVPGIPVTTGEIWSVWRDHPELVSAVDFIAVHILPFWEGVPHDEAVDAAIGAYSQLRARYPGKRIVIAEFGWPSAGYNHKAAHPGAVEQAKLLRDFVARAEAFGIDYNIIEAIDQPWKTSEGAVGTHWGIYNAAREAKFSWSGPIVAENHWKLMGIAVLVGVLLSLPALGLAGVTIPQAATLATATHMIGAWAATVFAYWNDNYLVTGAIIALAMGLLLLIPLIVITLARIDEIAAIAFGRKPQRLIASPPLAPEGFGPKISLHIPAYREPPDMLKQTLDAIAQLRYPNFECVLVINNTPDPAYWQPVEEHCRGLGERFKFIRDDNVPGFKAGALRLALQHTASDAEIIGVLDADYIVDPNWLTDLVPLFADPKVGLIQAPQDHRDGDRSVMHHAMQGEYSGFFDIGMVQRNEKNAIIAHGTMCLIRRAALDEAGGWSSDTICEDTDLGLSILENGWLAHYTNRRYGFGLLPDTYEGFKKQRHRWAYGGFQIIKKHWRRFLPGASRLSPDQKREFAFGWLNWLGAESLGVLVAFFNLLWVPVVAFAGIAIPDKILTIPIYATFAVTLLHFIALYRLRVAIPGPQMLGAVFAAMSVQWTVARAVADGLVKDHLPFARTPKGGARRKPREFQAFWEALFGGLLVLGAVTILVKNDNEVREMYIFAGVLLIQSLPFLSAAAMAAVEGTRVNDFAYWRSLATRVAELVRGRARTAATAAATAIVEAPAPNEKRIEPVQ